MSDQNLLFTILFFVFAFLIWGRWRYDLVAFSALLIAAALGAVPKEDVFSGFGHPAVVVIALVLIVSRGLSNSGAIDLLSRYLIDGSRKLAAHISIMAGFAAVLSAVMNNVAALALLMPLDMQAATKAKRSPALSLMPLSFASILGGMITMIGTPPNIVIAEYRATVLGEPYHMFDFAPVGLAVAIVGVAYVALIGWRLIPTARSQHNTANELGHLGDYLAEVKVPDGSSAIGQKVRDLDKITAEHEVEIVGLVRRGERQPGMARRVEIRKNDVLVLKAAAEGIEAIVGALGLHYAGKNNNEGGVFTTKDTSLLKVVVPQNARIDGRSARSLKLMYRHGVTLLGVSRQGQRVTKRVRELEIQAGDILLLLGENEKLQDIANWLGCLPLAGGVPQVTQRKKAGLAVLIFASAVLLASIGVLYLTVALGLAVVLMVLTGIMPLRELYKSVEWSVIVLLGSMIPIGIALETSGGTGLIASGIMSMTADFPPAAVMVILMIVTMTLSDVMNNVATAVIAAPIGVSIANTLGVSPDPFLMCVAVAASCAFLTPIGHKNNTLILGPGGYRFGDYWRMGLPLEDTGHCGRCANDFVDLAIVDRAPCFSTMLTMIAILFASLSLAGEIELNEEIEKVLAEESLTGAAWMLVSLNGQKSLGAAGFSDNKSKTRFTTATRFHVGSITKSLLSIGVLRLVTTGEIGLDTPVERYLPGLQFDNPWRAVHEVTVRHLLDHTAGLDDARMWQMFSERPKADTPLIAAFPEPDTQLGIRSQPGSQFSYSNMGYTLLGMIIESVTGDRYETYLDQHLLVPLGMLDSSFGFTTQEGENADASLAWGHVDDGSRYAASPVFLRPAAQFTTTVDDLARFAEFLLDGAKVDGQQFIDPTLMQFRGLPMDTDAAKNDLIAGYALGMGRRDRHGVIGYCHGGNILGFVAMLCIYPDEGKAFAYSMNTDSETADYGRIDKLLIESLGVSQASQQPSTEPAGDISYWYGRYVLRPNRFQSFEYLDTVFGAIEISAQADSLLMTSLQNKPRQLRPLGGYIYTANDRATASHVFLRGEEGQYRLSDGFKTYEKVPGVFLYAHWLSVSLGLLGLIWLFVAGFIALLRYRTSMIKRPVAPAFVTLLLLLIPIPLFLNQSFMALGDFTLASASLATVTLLLPFGMLLTLIRIKNSDSKTRVQVLHGLAAVSVLQWCVVLFSAGLLPLRLWI